VEWKFLSRWQENVPSNQENSVPFRSDFSEISEQQIVGNIPQIALNGSLTGTTVKVTGKPWNHTKNGFASHKVVKVTFLEQIIQERMFLCYKMWEDSKEVYGFCVVKTKIKALFDFVEVFHGYKNGFFLVKMVSVRIRRWTRNFEKWKVKKVVKKAPFIEVNLFTFKINQNKIIFDLISPDFATCPTKC
jgi:hypothetical protein